MCIRDGVLDFGVFGEGDFGLDFTGVGIEDIAKTPRTSLDGLAAYEMADLTHGSHSSDYFEVRYGDLGHLVPFCSDFCSFSVEGHELAALCRAFFLSRTVSLYPLLTAPV